MTERHSDPATALDGPQIVVRTMLRPSTFRRCRARADELGTDVGVLLSRLADKSLEPRAPQRARYTRLTEEQIERGIALRAAGMGWTELAAEVGARAGTIRTAIRKRTGEQT